MNNCRSYARQSVVHRLATVATSGSNCSSGPKEKTTEDHPR
jgi:hypothetical protein